MKTKQTEYITLEPSDFDQQSKGRETASYIDADGVLVFVVIVIQYKLKVSIPELITIKEYQEQ